MARLKQRHNKWEAAVRVPVAFQGELDRKFLYRTLTSKTRQGAKAEADVWEAALKARWAERNGHEVGRAALRALYQDTREDAVRGRFLVFTSTDEDPIIEGIDYEIDQIAEVVGPEEMPSPIQQARLNGLADAKRELEGRKVPRRKELELSLSELSAAYITWWKAQRGLKPSNTEQQKKATFALFAGYWKDRPIREVTRPVATVFMDALRHMDPLWARSPEARGMTWADLQETFGGRPQGLSDATLNRHAATMKTLWEWAADRGHCEGRNPFAGHHQRLRQGVNVGGYVAWETAELKKLLSPPPKRRDLHEIILVAMHSGLRLNEIASLTWEQVKEADGIHFFQIVDAKTPAGNRQVPVHPALAWLLKRREQASSDDRLWPSFNAEGPGKKPGADAGKEFSRFKQGRGFTDRRKAFHSFRKNVTRQIERHDVHESQWAQVFGHERGMTFGVYNPDGITLQRKAEIIGLIAYPDLDVVPRP